MKWPELARWRRQETAMAGEFGIWQVDEATKASHRLEQAERAVAEAMLEEVFVRNPAMLMPGLELVSRQLPTASGCLDLLGVDSEGRLTLFELKREEVTRKAVTQGIDYASWLDSLDEVDLWKRIVENSGRRGVGKIENFEAWYEDHDDWDSLEALRPVRIVLVGLGADESAQRMVDWLVAKDVEIDLLTFVGYRCGDRMLLARQLEDRDAERRQARQEQEVSRRAEIRMNRRSAIDSKVDEYGMRDWWETPSPYSNAISDVLTKPSWVSRSSSARHAPCRQALERRVRTRLKLPNRASYASCSCRRRLNYA